ncbi:MAG TPA: divalent-cation tolerance protein CutA [Bacteroidetes bacterium]|nr:divalent-cation tolerance protein CutA [bacterium BMS3Bbin04]HDO66245.1 divalent-cation tolerance protein CutA [Bacteroidota bacterium]HEX05370.1 divalent-cation tolerance protein CutA [Bacteroidota bacterium]
MANVKLVFVTVPAQTGNNGLAGRNLANSLVTEGIAACVNRIPGLNSHYLWEDDLHEDEEELLLIKTTSKRLKDLTRRIEELHPSDVPEVLVVDVEDGLPAYLKWVTEQCRK